MTDGTGLGGGQAAEGPGARVHRLSGELAEFGRKLRALGERLEHRPEQVSSTELMALISEAGQASGTLLDYRQALVNLWRLEYPSEGQS